MPERFCKIFPTVCVLVKLFSMKIRHPSIVSTATFMGDFFVNQLLLKDCYQPYFLIMTFLNTIAP